MDRLSGITALGVLAVAFAVAPAAADVQVSSFSVTALVVARTTLESIDVPESVTLSASDLAQGYKDVDARYRVHVAGTQSYVLNIAPRTGLASSIRIDGLAAPVTLGDTDITVLRAAAATVEELRLRFRLELRPGAPAGTYTLPLRVSVSALGIAQ